VLGRGGGEARRYDYVACGDVGYERFWKEMGIGLIAERSGDRLSSGV
jgi:hypothetical protein